MPLSLVYLRTSHSTHKHTLPPIASQKERSAPLPRHPPLCLSLSSSASVRPPACVTPLPPPEVLSSIDLSSQHPRNPSTHTHALTYPALSRGGSSAGPDLKGRQSQQLSRPSSSREDPRHHKQASKPSSQTAQPSLAQPLPRPPPPPISPSPVRPENYPPRGLSALFSHLPPSALPLPPLPPLRPSRVISHRSRCSLAVR